VKAVEGMRSNVSGTPHSRQLRPRATVGEKRVGHMPDLYECVGVL
jgi:hypothetical protein